MEEKAMREDAVFYTFENRKYDSEIHFHFYNAGTTPLHSHDYFEFFVITKGEALHSFQNEIISLPPGTVCFIKPYEIHQFLKGESGHEHFNVAIETSSFNQICNALSPAVFFTLVNGKRYYQMFESEFEHFNSLLEIVLTSNEQQAAILVKSMIASIAAQFVRFTNNTPPMPAWLKDFCEKIQFSEYFLRSIEELSKLVPYSRSILNSTFKEYMNDTLISYITKQRITYAANLLAFSDYSIVDISNMINYSSLSHFNRTFKTTLGYTPAEYRHLFFK